MRLHGTKANASFKVRGHTPCILHRNVVRCKMALNAAVFRTSQGAWVSTSRTKPRGVCHFLGGAFAGAAPQIVYSLFIQLLSDAGYTVITTPYAVTFKHLDCARTVQEAFQSSLQELRADPSTRTYVPETAPVFGVGHSNGALLLLLMGCLYPKATAGNVVISYNNKQVSDAIPIPGFLDALAPSLRLSRDIPLPLPIPVPTATDVLKGVSSVLPKFLLDNSAGQISSAALALDQFGSVFGEVGDGTTDFTPNPAESREMIGKLYDIPRTLMVRFAEDSIDQTPEMEDILKARTRTDLTGLRLNGTHLTPTGTDFQLQAGANFTPVNVVAQLIKYQAETDVRQLTKQVVDWLDAGRYERLRP